VLYAPHPIRFLKGLRGPQQLRRSWYILAFQLPWLPERLIAARDFQALRRTLGRQPTRPGVFTAQDIDRYVAAAAQPGALRAAINYYRAAVRANPLAQAHTVRR
jgi:epoxide hydrolase 4